MLDHQLSDLQQKAKIKARSEAALAALAQEQGPLEGLEGMAAELAGLAYQRWADARRGEINIVLARQTRDWLEAQDSARLAFGKAEALRRIHAKLGR